MVYRRDGVGRRSRIDPPESGVAKKHRTLQTTFLDAPKNPDEIFDLFEWDPSLTILEQRAGQTVMLGTYEDGTELARFRFAPSDRPRPYARIKGTLQTRVMVGYERNPGVAMRMDFRGWQDMSNRVEEIVADLEPFL